MLSMSRQWDFTLLFGELLVISLVFVVYGIIMLVVYSYVSDTVILELPRSIPNEGGAGQVSTGSPEKQTWCRG